MKQSLNVIYEDNHLLVAIKEPGVLSQPGEKNLDDMLTLGKAYIKEKYGKPGNVFLGLVHRLDLNVGGVMAFARTSKAAARLFDEIQNGEFQKSYYAVVEGKLPIGSFQTLTNYLSKDEQRRQCYEDKKNGKESILDYKVLENSVIDGVEVSLVDITLHTGRFHQIRCQFSLFGHPLYGDQKYHSNASTLETSLFAYRLKMNHPTTKEPLIFEVKPTSKVFQTFHL